MDRESVQKFGETLKARGRQPATIESYCRDAQRFLEFLDRSRIDPNQVEPGILVSYQDHLRHDCAERDNSIRRTVIGIRQFYRFLTESHAIGSTPFDDVPIPTRDDSLPRGLCQDDVDAVMQVAAAGRPDFKAARDSAMISLLAHEGLKANEIINLTWADLLTSQSGQGSLRITGPRTRVIPLSQSTSEQLINYRRLFQGLRHPAIARATVKRMFIAFKGRDAASPLPEMTRHGLKFIVYELGEKAGIAKLNTEQLRHFAVGWLLSTGLTPEEIMGRLGLRRLGNIAKHISKSRARSADDKRTIEGATRA